MSEISADQAREYLAYDPDTGVITWKVSAGRSKAGSVAGSLHNQGYVQIKLLRTKYLAHRLAWLITTGQWPEDQIDHINGIRSDNRLSNLRQATSLINCKNQALRTTNKSGVNGVDWDKKAGKWRAQIKVNRKTIWLGAFDDIEKAIAARMEADIKYGFHENHGKAA